MGSIELLGVTNDAGASVRYYVDGLGFQMTKQWIEKCKLRWCWLQYGAQL